VNEIDLTYTYYVINGEAGFVNKYTIYIASSGYG